MLIQYIDVNVLTNTIVNLVNYHKTGFVTLGYYPTIYWEFKQC